MKTKIKVFFFKKQLNLFDTLGIGMFLGAAFDKSYISAILIVIVTAAVSAYVDVFHPEGLNSK